MVRVKVTARREHEWMKIVKSGWLRSAACRQHSLDDIDSCAICPGVYRDHNRYHL